MEKISLIVVDNNQHCWKHCKIFFQNQGIFFLFSKKGKTCSPPLVARLVQTICSNLSWIWLIFLFHLPPWDTQAKKQLLVIFALNFPKLLPHQFLNRYFHNLIHRIIDCACQKKLYRLSFKFLKTAI